MKTDDEKRAIRDELGMQFFMRIAEGVCPYCTKPLVPPPESWPTYGESLACVDCVSLFGMPEDDDGDGLDDIENMTAEGGVERADETFVARWTRGRCPSCEKPLSAPSPSVFPAEVLSAPEFADARACNTCPRLLSATSGGQGVIEWTSEELKVHAFTPAAKGVTPSDKSAQPARNLNKKKILARRRLEKARRKDARRIRRR